jgi:voltage-gated potassium channel
MAHDEIPKPPILMSTPAPDGEKDVAVRPYQLFMLGLCLYVLTTLAVQTFFPLDSRSLAIFDTLDTAVAIIFLLDFFYCLLTAANRWQYFLRWGWIDLLSSIPMVDVLRWGRAARVFRILRVLRGLRAARFLSSMAYAKRAECAFWAAALISLLVIVFGSIAILHLETTLDANIATAEDALWWSFVTVTTVGYGDHFPVTTAGRALAVLLMATGIGLIGTFTAFVAAAFLAPGEKLQEREMAALRLEIRALRTMLSAPTLSAPGSSLDRKAHQLDGDLGDADVVDAEGRGHDIAHPAR